MTLGKASEIKFALIASNGRQQLQEWLEENRDVEVLDIKFDFDNYPKFLVIYRDN
ncbi:MULTISPECIES: hypothetical protein [Lysinibacillus]|uniref:Uncharacterized protein n=4 Tax=Lysinibacillus TaxID=400634 RepID=A0A6H0A1D5_LYSSH|nr:MULTISPECIES: hypothetical protein [Lysinibacillus]MBE5085807.1 hypothetical protein [Bacillus thuringiensis]ACA42346.1 hypothetical protein Bsph_p116 [Lysinibacillus sphaericus C3-41]MDR0161538.1 hypothetical protein [Lysinibacillus sphaericus]QIS31129.1 hypothetical protein [Lysinibacillus sphaericus]QPA52507.1 hypothetical protein INQ54_23700 [Lysinibacillus sphaericus]